MKTTQQPGHRRSYLQKQVMRGLLATAIGVTILPLSAHLSLAVAAENAAARGYDIPAGALDKALSHFAGEAGVVLSFEADQAKHLTTKGLKGSATIRQGFEVLLQGTGLKAVEIQPGRYSLKVAPLMPLQKSDVDTLPEVHVNAVYEKEPSAVTEGSGSYTTSSMNTATKMNLSIRETPQSVSVMSRQQMDDQGLVTLDDAAQNITGLTMQKGYYVGDSGSFFSRGFPISNLLIDGLPTSLGANGTFNADNDSLDIYDRVEVVRGATGLTTGAGTPSAAINLVRKRPTAEKQASILFSAGSWNNYRSVFDASGPLNEAGTLRGRTVITAQDADRFYDHAHDRNQQFYGILEADLTPNTVASVGVQYRHVNNDGVVTGLPVNADGSFLQGLKRSTNLANDFDFWRQTDRTLFADLTHKFGNDWQLKAAAIWKRPEQDTMFSGLSRIGGVLYQNSQRYRLDNKQDSYDIALNGPFSLGGRTHELMMGASDRQYDNKNWGGWAAYSWSASGPVVDPYNWNASVVSKPDIDMSRWNIDTTARQQAIYAATRLNIADSLKAIVGARSNWYQNQNHRTDVEYKVTREVTPYAGLIYDLDRNHSLYTSWTEIFEPQSSYDKNGKLLEPITGTNYEVGVKGAYFDGRLNASLATFLIKQQNRAVDDLSGPSPCPGSAFGYCKRAAGEVESKGIDMELSGALTPDWQIMAGYAYVSAKYTKDQDAANIGQAFNSNLPKHQLKLATSYRLPGKLHRLRIGGTVYVQNAIQAMDDSNIQQGGYTIVGLNGSYDLNERTEIRLNINNLFDKYYYQSLGWSTGGNVFGAPRNALLTARYRF